MGNIKNDVIRITMLLSGFMIFGTVIISMTPPPSQECPFGYSISDIIEHRTGMNGVIVRCNGGLPNLYGWTRELVYMIGHYLC